MTLQIVLTLTILAVAMLLFVTERLRVDLIAMIVLAVLALTGLVTPEEALSGFSNPAVVTVWAVFVLSGGLSRTGVANVVGRGVLRLAGKGETRLLITIMLISGLMSAFMNNVGVVALMLPVVLTIARQTGIVPSKLLMPLAYGALLGGMTTLISTPTNILVSDALRDAGLASFGLFDYTAVGGAALVGGIVFMFLIGRHLLPARDTSRNNNGGAEALARAYELQDRLYCLRLPRNSPLAGKTLAESRLGIVLGVNVLGIVRNGHTKMPLSPDERLYGGDELLVTGKLDKLAELKKHPHLVVEENGVALENLITDDILMAEISLSPRSHLLGKTLQELDFRNRFGVMVVALWRDGKPIHTNLDNIPLQHGDVLLVQGKHEQIETLQKMPDFLVSKADQAGAYRLEEWLTEVRIPSESNLAGKTLAESRLAKADGLTVLGIIRDGKTLLMPNADEELRARDRLLVKGRVEENLETIRGLQTLEVAQENEPTLRDLETERVGLVEATLSPHSMLVGKTLRQINFREKYGLSVLAIQRQGHSYRSNLNEIPLDFGDALLLFGRRDKLKVFAQEPDFLVLEEEIQEAPRLNKAPLAVLIMGGVVVTALFGWLPIAIAAVIGGTLMVLTGCLSMEEAYRYIDWRAVFLIAGMLPLGIAMENSGAARFLAEGMVNAVDRFGPLALIAGLFLLSALASQVIPNAVVAVLLSPIGLNAASNLGLSPYALMMVIAVSASSSFLTPIGHPANVLIMGPGGYRFSDYIKVGLPLTVVVMIMTLLVLPVVWPLGG